MHLHVLTGYAEFLRPEILPTEEVGEIAGPNIRSVHAYWLYRNCGNEYHDFLQEEPDDSRVTVIADAIKNDFGERFEPLLVLPELLANHAAGDDPGKRSQVSVLCEILGSGHFAGVNLYGLALSEDADPDGCCADHLEITTAQAATRLDQLSESLSGQKGPDSVTQQVVEVLPGMPCFDSLFNNAVANAITCRLEPRFVSAGWRIEKSALAKAIVSVLTEWNASGLFVGQPLGKQLLADLTDTLQNRLMQQ